MLPRLRSETAGPSFEDLVESVTTDVRPRAVLDDFLAQGIVILEPEDQIRLNPAAFILRPGNSEQLFLFGRNLHDHIAAAVANVTARGGPKFVDSTVHYDRLTPEATERLLAIAHATAAQALLDVNRTAISLLEASDSQLQQATETRRVNFGIYVYTEDETVAREEDN